MRRKKGIALISLLMITVIIIMLMSSFLVISSSNSRLVGNYKERESCLQVAEAGLNYALYQLNNDNTWKGDQDDGSGFKETKKTLSNTGGEFYITFNPNKDYCSYNNLKSSGLKNRATAPGGKVPPYFAQIIVTATVGSVTKHIQASFIREDFYTNNISSEGPIWFKKAKEVHVMKSDTEQTDGRLHSNSDANTAIIVDPNADINDPNSIVNTHNGTISACGIIKGISSANNKLVEHSVKQQQGVININNIIQNKNASVELNPGHYHIKMTAGGNPADPNSYKVYYGANPNSDPNSLTLYNGTGNPISFMDGWAYFDSNGNIIVDNNVYIKGGGGFKLTFGYTTKDKVLYTEVTSTSTPVVPTPTLPFIIPTVPGGEGEDHSGGTSGATHTPVPTSTIGSNHGGSSTPTPPPTNTPRPPPPPNGGGNKPGENDFIFHSYLTPPEEPYITLFYIPCAYAAEVSYTFKLPPEIKLQGNKTIYSSSSVDLEGRVSGTGSIVSEGDITVVAEESSSNDCFALLTDNKLTVKVDPMTKFNYKGLFYSNDDITFKSQHVIISPDDARKDPVFINTFAGGDPNNITAERIYLGGDFTTGGVFISQNKNHANPEEASILINTPKKVSYFNTDYSYITVLNNIANYKFKIKLLSFQEI